MRFLFILLFLVTSRSYSQKDLGSWNILNLKYTFNDKWSAFGEGQIRSLKFYDNFHYYEVKGGVNYKFSNSFQFTLASGTYQTYREGGNFVLPKNNDEFRIWPQVVLSQSIGKIKVEQRYRAELRFTSNGYRNRFRYRLGLSYSIGKEKEGIKPFQVMASNELFFTNKEPYFERNRLAFNVGYRVTKTLMFQLGYLHQFDYKINDETGRDFLQIGCYLDFKKKQKE